MIQLQFRDAFGRETLVSFLTNGIVKIELKEYGAPKAVAQYSKSSPIATMYQRLLHDSREVSPNLFQVIGAW